LNSRLELTNIADRRCAVSFSYQLRDATDLHIRITDEWVQEALAQLIGEKEEQRRQIEEETTVDR
jgi:hypothetical protein